MNYQNKPIFYHLVSLLLGGIIYIIFRSKNLKMFDWLDLIGIKNLFDKIRFSFQDNVFEIPKWIIFSLPDGLWTFSYICLTLYIWESEITRTSIVWITIVPLIAIISEIGQLYGLVSGTYDIMDLLFYIIGVISPFLLFCRTIKYNIKLIK